MDMVGELAIMEKYGLSHQELMDMPSELITIGIPLHNSFTKGRKAKEQEERAKKAKKAKRKKGR